MGLYDNLVWPAERSLERDVQRDDLALRREARPRGATQPLPQMTVTDDDASNACAICLHQQASGEQVARMPCGHLFCPACITGWLEKSCTCPVCRYDLEADDLFDELDSDEHLRQ